MKLFLIALLAISFFPSAEADDSTSAAWNLQGDDLMNQSKYDEAIQAYDRALKIDESNIAALTSRGEALIYKGEYNASLAAFDRALEMDPHYMRALIDRGMALHALGDLNMSLDSYDRALKIDSKYARAWNGKAWLSYKQDEHQNAINYSDRAISIMERELSYTLDTKAMALAALGRYEDALAYIDRAIGLHPSDSVEWMHKGDILKALGRGAESEEAYARAREINNEVINDFSA